MTLSDYKASISVNNFDEFPEWLGPGITSMEPLIDYSETDKELKIYMVTVSLNRNFSSTDGHEVLTDHYWLIENFMDSYKKYLVKPWLTETIREAINMIISTEAFTKYLIGTIFMFGIIKLYAKHMLGYRLYRSHFF